MQHHIALGPFLEQPAREGAAPFVAAALQQVELDEGAGLLFRFPGRGGLAGAQPHDGIAHAQGLARLQRESAREAVALVEQAQFRLALRHWRAGQFGGGLGQPLVGGELLLIGLVGGIAGAFGRPAATGEHRGEADENQPSARRGGPQPGHASGAQAS